MEKIRKHYEINTITNKKIQQLLQYRVAENEQAGISSHVSEKMIFEDAIDLMYSSKFGKDVFDQTMTKLENVLGNMMQKVLEEYMQRQAAALENIYLQAIENKEMLLLIIKANGILPDENQITSLIMMNTALEESIRSAILQKKEFYK